MKNLTKEQAKKYVRERNPAAGIDAITIEYLLSIDLDSVPNIVERGKRYGSNFVKFSDGCVYTFDLFTPKANSTYLKPSFAGRQVLMGKDENGDLMFSNGSWFSA